MRKKTIIRSMSTRRSERKATIKYAKLSFSFYQMKYIDLTQLDAVAEKNQ